MRITFDGDEITGQYNDSAVLPEGLETIWLPDGVTISAINYDEEAEAEEVVFLSVSTVMGSLTLDQFRATCKNKVDAVLKQVEDGLIGQFSNLERLALDAKYNEALHYKVSGTLPAASIIEVEAQILNVPVPALVDAIVAKGAPYRALLGAVSAFRAMSDQVLAQEDPAAIQAGLEGLLVQAGPYLGQAS